MAVIPHHLTDPQVAIIKTLREAGVVVVVVVVVQMQVVEMNSQLSSIPRTPTFRISE
jgi:hypothetical protein